METDKIHWFEQFYNQLYNQYLYLCDGGTSYRIESSRLSLEVAKQENNIEFFFDFDQATNIVSSYFSNIDEDRLHDVSKMLYLNANRVKGKNTQPKEIKAAIEERMKNRKPLRLTKDKKE